VDLEAGELEALALPTRGVEELVLARGLLEGLVELVAASSLHHLPRPDLSCRTGLGI
jgi:hypothetical protein